ncbi:hypothetical protein MtrunA17_Chr4g0002841 [Medicago truncatula]|uniref:Uncharacterized protein n=1 Tax=Medicago truncatula TaxID=3880 RepID=A0A396I4D9_MEDTR|nr:hypothetical protein MtrunA17_Chr4g0002841 [Medicago truncatula]
MLFLLFMVPGNIWMLYDFVVCEFLVNLWLMENLWINIHELFIRCSWYFLDLIRVLDDVTAVEKSLFFLFAAKFFSSRGCFCFFCPILFLQP